MATVSLTFSQSAFSQGEAEDSIDDAEVLEELDIDIQLLLVKGSANDPFRSFAASQFNPC